MRQGFSRSLLIFLAMGPGTGFDGVRITLGRETARTSADLKLVACERTSEPPAVLAENSV